MYTVSGTILLGPRSKSSIIIGINLCLYWQTTPVWHQQLCRNSHVTVWSLNYQITHYNWTIWSLQGVGLALSQKYFLPCTIWWDKCRSISILMCVWVVSLALLMMLRLSQNKWKCLRDAPWKEKWRMKQLAHCAWGARHFRQVCSLFSVLHYSPVKVRMKIAKRNKIMKFIKFMKWLRQIY